MKQFLEESWKILSEGSGFVPGHPGDQTHLHDLHSAIIDDAQNTPILQHSLT